MKTVGIVQCRVGSNRLPYKIMKDLCGKPAIVHLLERAKRSKMVDEWCVAFPATADNLAIQETVKMNFIDIIPFAYSGDENDLIGRYFESAKELKADIIIRTCSDNFLIDPAEIDRAVAYWNDSPSVFVSNMHQHPYYRMIDKKPNGYPDGIGCEVFSMSRLKWMHENISEDAWREHPHLIFHEYSVMHGVISSPKCPSEISRPDLRLDVNTQADLDYVRSIYEIVYPKNPQFTTKEVIEAIDSCHLERRIVPA